MSLESSKISLKPTKSTCVGIDINKSVSGDLTHFEGPCLQSESSDIIKYKGGDGILVIKDTISNNIGSGLTFKDGKTQLDTEATLLPDIITIIEEHANSGVATLAGTSSIKERGDSTYWIVSYKYILGIDQSKPISVTGLHSSLPIPDNNTLSQQIITIATTSNQSYSIGFSKPKTGLIVSNGNVIPAIGDDTKSVSLTLSFYDAVYNGISSLSNMSNIEIKTLTKQLRNSKSSTFSGITTGANDYFHYLYPKSLGQLTSVIMDGATPVLGAFSMLEEVSFTTDTNLIIQYYHYRSNDRGAFNNNTLAFS